MAWFRLLAESGFSRLELPGVLAVVSGLQSNTENGAVLDPRSEAADAVVAWLAAQDVPASILLTADLLATRRMWRQFNEADRDRNHVITVADDDPPASVTARIREGVERGALLYNRHAGSEGGARDE